MPETRDVQIEDHRVTVELAADDEQVAGLLEKLVASGVRMSSFAEKEPTLEDVFMLVTKGAPELLSTKFDTDEPFVAGA